MSREKFLSISVVFLLVLNLGIVGFLLTNRPKHPPELWKLVVEKAGFDESQQHAYLLLRDEHRAIMNQLDAQFEESLKRYLSTLAQEPNSEAENATASELARVEQLKAQYTLEHFRRVKALCRPDQKLKFDAMIPDLMPILLPPKDPRRRMKVPGKPD